MFYSIGIIEPGASHNKDLARVVKAARKKYGGSSREANTMKVLYRRTRIRGWSVLPAMAMGRPLEAMMVEN